MKEKQGFSIKKRLQSFIYAFRGLKTLFREEHNARIHLFFGVLAILLGVLFCISPIQWIAILLCIALVFSLELVNSSIENLSDFSTTERNDFIRKAKDMAAAAVFVAAMISLVIGMIIFLPKLFNFIYVIIAFVQ